MRIGIDAHAIGSGSSGNETYYEELLKHLATAPTNGSWYVVYYTHLTAPGRISVTEKVSFEAPVACDTVLMDSRCFSAG